jgi:hypothetical protein
MAGTGA